VGVDLTSDSVHLSESGSEKACIHAKQNVHHPLFTPSKVHFKFFGCTNATTRRCGALDVYTTLLHQSCSCAHRTARSGDALDARA
jgi:hypothetical protein